MFSNFPKGHELPGMVSGLHKFSTVAPFSIVQLFTHDPQILQPTSKPQNREIEEFIALHQMVQRALTGKKADNAPAYARYIEEIVAGKRPGILPPIHLWTDQPLELKQKDNRLDIILPYGLRLLAIDGETQLTAHYRVYSSSDKAVRDKHAELPLDIIIHHGVQEDTARQYFYDLNLLAVRPNVSVGASMNSEDLFTQVADKLEKGIPTLIGRVDRQARQLTKKSPRILTFNTLRQMVVNTAKGIGGVQYGARPVPIDGVDQSHLSDVADEWIRLVFETFKTEIENREDYVIGSPGVLAAIGAMGRNLYDIREGAARGQLRSELLNSLRAVDWHKGAKWDGIAGKMTTNGLSVGGPKEVSYSVYNALTDSGQEQYSKIR